MIYFQNYYHGTCGLNNHVIPYTLCISLSNLLDRDFYFDHEVPPSTPPDFAVGGDLRDKFAILMTSPRAKVSDLVAIPCRRVYEIEREIEGKIRIDDPFKFCVSDEATASQFGGTPIQNYFTLGREVMIKETLKEAPLIEVGVTGLVNVSYFYFLSRAEKDALLSSVRLRYRQDIEQLAARIVGELGAFHSMHLRTGDFLRAYESDGFRIDIDRFRRYLDVSFSKSNLPVMIATDDLEQKGLFRELLGERKHVFIDELIFESFEREFRELEFTDYGALAVLDQLICAAGDVFVGSCRSTFTSIIHRLRQERYARTDFEFLPDERVAKLLDENFRIVPDQTGFFDWNRYSVFSEDYRYPAWMREWNYELTSIG